MIVSYSWLLDFLPPLDLTPRAVADLLTMRAATVEEVEPVRAELQPFVVARVVESERIPETKLSINKVDDGSGELLDVICGAPNVQAGRLYPFARTGTTMPGGLTIERRKIRGFFSNGMLCSARELGLGESHEGIMELEVDAAPGTPLIDALPAVSDTRLVLDVLPNRPDLLSHLGVAREVAAARGVSLRPEIARPVPAGDAAAEPVRDTRQARAGSIAVTLEDAEGAPRYLGVVVRGVRVGASPEWLRQRVESVGGRSINNIVDVTNFMLHGYGQPMHAFDAAKLAGGAVIVRRARPGESLVTLDGVERVLDPVITVIADAERAQAIAGIMGGRESEVTESTTDIFLEVAYFDPTRTRRARRALNLSTDASYRFERGTDIEACLARLVTAVQLITRVAGGEADGAPVDLYPPHERQREIPLRVERVARVLGHPIPAATIAPLLGSVGFAVRQGDAGALLVDPPSWRADVTAEIDLIEEVARLYGYDELPSDVRPYRPGTVPDAPLHLTARRVREALVAEGLLEALAVPFVTGAERGYVRVANPMAENEAFLRRDVLESLARRAEHNLAQMQRTVRLFEIGSAFAPGDGPLPLEEMRVAALVLGDRHPQHWTEPHTPQFDEWDAKWLAEVMVRAAYPGAPAELRPAGDEILWEIVLDGRVRGWVRRVPLDGPVWAAPAFGVELSLAERSAVPVAPPRATSYTGNGARETTAARRFVPLPTTPASGFDLALLVPNDMPAERVESVLARELGTLLERSALLSEFRGGSVPEGFRSLAWQITLRHPSRTLESREIAGRRERLLKALEGELGVRIR